MQAPRTQALAIHQEKGEYFVFHCEPTAQETRDSEFLSPVVLSHCCGGFVLKKEIGGGAKCPVGVRVVGARPLSMVAS